MLSTNFQPSIKFRLSLITGPFDNSEWCFGMTARMQESNSEPRGRINANSNRVGITQAPKLKFGNQIFCAYIRPSRSFDCDHLKESRPESRFDISRIRHRDAVVYRNGNESNLESSPQKKPVHCAPLLSTHPAIKLPKCIMQGERDENAPNRLKKCVKAHHDCTFFPFGRPRGREPGFGGLLPFSRLAAFCASVFALPPLRPRATAALFFLAILQTYHSAQVLSKAA
jgi:hypothetical protein